jgi:hypothetical protein
MSSEEGTVNFWIKPNRPSDFTDPMPARFPPFTSGDIKVEVIKNPDRRAHVTISGLHGRRHVLSGVIPPCDSRGLMVTVTWTSRLVTLFLNGKDVDTAEIPVQ